MRLRQKLLRLAYPLYRFFSAHFGEKGKILHNDNNQVPPASFHKLSAILNTGERLDFNSCKGKYVLIVNTASDCVYTSQYTELRQLATQYNQDLVIIAFPSNDFNEQEKGSNEEIAAFCSTVYGIGFPVSLKTPVKGDQMHEVYKWLSLSSLNGWNNQQPVWNFSKYLVDKNGILRYYFGPAIPPADIGKLLESQPV